MKRFKLLTGLFCGLLLQGCSLDYENTEAITPDAVWTDVNMINSYLANIYGNMTPGWPITSNNTDEGMNNTTEMSQFVRGEYSVENDGQGLDYTNIDRINFFLGHMQEVGPEVMSEEEKNARLGTFYTDLTLDGRFVALTDNNWDLRKNHTYDKVHIDYNEVYSEEEDSDDKDKEEESEDEESEKEVDEEEGEEEGNKNVPLDEDIASFVGQNQ